MAKKSEIIAKLNELGIKFEDSANKKELEELLASVSPKTDEPKTDEPKEPEEKNEEKPKDNYHPSVRSALKRLGEFGLPDGILHLLNVGGGFFVLASNGLPATHFSEDGEEKKKFIKFVTRSNQRGEETSSLIKKRQEAASKAGKDYDPRVEVNLG